MTNKLETLASLARWKAFVRKYRGFTSNHKDEAGFIKSIHDYQKRWISDGLGTPLASIQDIDVIEGIIDFNISMEEISKLDCGDLKLYLKACYAIEYDKDEDN